MSIWGREFIFLVNSATLKVSYWFMNCNHIFNASSNSISFHIMVRGYLVGCRYIIHELGDTGILFSWNHFLCIVSSHISLQSSSLTGYHANHGSHSFVTAWCIFISISWLYYQYKLSLHLSLFDKICLPIYFLEYLWVCLVSIVLFSFYFLVIELK